ncbi:MAG: sulfatase-like hydrolase/transferase [Alphaproteobacteria bacterium]|nr:sulfatase-like hydrolase/transferase [Alphaproteobacteria bacterium]
MLEGLENALKDPAEKKIIFMHLLGSHNDAKNRYPDTFHSPLVDKKEKKSYSATEHYKNAAAYTNTFLAKALLTLKDQKEPTAAIYFSDHGDDPVVPFARNYNKIKGVPLFFWLSKKYQKQFPNQFKNLNCLQYVYFSNLPYLFNQVIGVDIIDISASSEIKACFAKEENK